MQSNLPIKQTNILKAKFIFFFFTFSHGKKCFNQMFPHDAMQEAF